MPTPVAVIDAVSPDPSASEFVLIPGPITYSVEPLLPMRLFAIVWVEPALADPVALDWVTENVRVSAGFGTTPADEPELAIGQISTPLIVEPLIVHDPPETKTPM